MFSEKNRIRIEDQFQKRVLELPVLKQEIDRLHALKAEIALAVKYLYITMPFSDIGNYPFDTFCDYANHGVYLLEQGPYRERVSEDLFLNYILYHRINEEEILPCRSFFYEQLKERIVGLTMKEAALEVNYWCAQEATYRSTDERTVAPITVYHCGYGRCGEESTFTVSALRSIGIPARQVYAPRWSHCEDNHAWVEVWCDGEWYFLGACEPEEILNKGWFNSASSRAMLVHSRYFDSVMDLKAGNILGKDGMVTMLNQLGRYAQTELIKVSVLDDLQNPVKGMKVEFQIVNYSEFFTLAVIKTDETGTVTLKTGLGSINIHISYKDTSMDLLIDTRVQKEAAIILKSSTEAENCWQPFDMIAPLDSPVNNRMPTLIQKAEGEVKSAAAAKKRQNKTKNIRNKELDEFLISDEIHRSLKEKFLGILTVKDLNDCTAQVLEEHFAYALPYKDLPEAAYTEEIFLQYLLNPRIQNEPLIEYRARIEGYFSDKEKEDFKDSPKLIWKWIEENIQSHEDREHPNVVTTPAGCLKTGTGSKLAKEILFTAVARTLGIPARLKTEDGSMEYFCKGEFIPVLEEGAGVSTLLLDAGEGSITWTYYQNYTIARYDKGTYTTLKLEGTKFHGGQAELTLRPGKYRIITSNRLPNGNIFANRYLLTLKAGEEKEALLSLREAKLSDMLENVKMNDFMLKKAEGNTVADSGITASGNEYVSGSEITKGGKRILFWLEVGKEPTEHILNELLDRKNEFREYAKQLIFIIRNNAALSDPALDKVIECFPTAAVLYDDFGDNVQTLGRRLYVDPDKLPLIIVTSNVLNGIYATSGYNVGTGDMLLRILSVEF
jgi:transglutaminase-like putative cysteine protease